MDQADTAVWVREAKAGSRASFGPAGRSLLDHHGRHVLEVISFDSDKSAAHLDSNRKPMMVTCEEGRVALTFRNYTGEKAQGVTWSLFLWPEKDGTSIESLLSNFEGDTETIFDKLKRETSKAEEGAGK